MYYITTIHPNGDMKNSSTPSVPNLDTLREPLEDGSLIELVPGFDLYGGRDCLAFCDEEGKLKSLEQNEVATYLWYACLAKEPFNPDVLHGPVTIVAVDNPALLKEL